MSDRIYVRQPDGQIEKLEAEPFASEDAIQELIADHPDLLGGGRIRPENPRRWILISREQRIAEALGESDRWALDHLLIDQDATPTLVEVKRGSNTQVRREVVGQLLEYAAHARQSWDVADLRRIFEDRDDSEGALRALLEAKEELDADSFWRDVETNLRASKLRLLFVADDIPSSLMRIVEFLNEQMRDVEVLAIDLKRYSGEQSETFVPTVIGALAAPASKSAGADNWTRRTFPEAFQKPSHSTAARSLMDAASRAGATFLGYRSGISIRTRVHDIPLTIAWLLAPGRESSWQPVREFSFGAGNANNPEFFNALPDDLRARLKAWADEFAGDAFTYKDPRTDLQTPGVAAWCVSYDDAAEHIDVLGKRLERVLADLQAL